MYSHPSCHALLLRQSFCLLSVSILGFPHPTFLHVLIPTPWSSPPAPQLNSPTELHFILLWSNHLHQTLLVSSITGYRPGEMQARVRVIAWAVPSWIFLCQVLQLYENPSEQYVWSELHRKEANGNCFCLGLQIEFINRKWSNKNKYYAQEICRSFHCPASHSLYGRGKHRTIPQNEGILERKIQLKNNDFYMELFNQLYYVLCFGSGVFSHLNNKYFLCLPFPLTPPLWVFWLFSDNSSTIRNRNNNTPQGIQHSIITKL